MTLATELKDGLMAIYGERLRGVFLYGSRARGTAGPDSDLDVLVVLDRVESYSSEVDRTSELVARLSLSSGLPVSRVFVPQSDWEEGATSFLRNVRSEALAA